MPTLQTAFNDFHNAIKLSDIDENDTLREKRDILLKKLKDNLSKNENAVVYDSHFDQGSYAMHTGINPDNDDFDIDVGLLFPVDKDDYTDPTTLKKWVRDALDGHTASVKIRKSCVTVTYQREGEAIYHVDLAIYASGNKDGNLYLAKGAEFAAPENKFWEPSDPKELKRLINEHLNEDDRKQFRRVIRYLKKWKSIKFSSDGHAAPTGISLTILAYNLFVANSTYDAFASKFVYNDFEALQALVKAILSQFTLTYDEDYKTAYDICTKLPTTPYNDLFAKMTLKQTTAFHDKLVAMDNVLDDVASKTALSDKCSLLIGLFGDSFPALSDKSVLQSTESA